MTNSRNTSGKRHRQAVDPHIVVFPEAARRLQVAMRSLAAARRPAADAAVAVDQVGLAPQLALPFRGLLQQVAPGDAVVVRRLEAAVVDAAADRLVEIADQPAVDGKAGED